MRITKITFAWMNHASGIPFDSSSPVFTGLTPLEAFFEYNINLEERGLYRLLRGLTSLPQPIPPTMNFVFTIETENIHVQNFSTQIAPYNSISDMGVRITRVAMDALAALYLEESGTPAPPSNSNVNILNLAPMSLDTTQPDFESLISNVEEQINSASFDKSKVLFELRRLRIEPNSVLNVFNEPLVQTNNEFAIQILGNKKTLKNIAVSVYEPAAESSFTLSFIKKLPITESQEKWIYKTIQGCYIRNAGKKVATVPIIVAHVQSENS